MKQEKIAKLILLLIVIVCVITIPASSKKQGIIIFTKGDVEIISNDNVSRKAAVKGYICENERIRTGIDSGASIQVTDTGVIRVLQNTEAVFKTIMESDEDTVLELRQGQVYSKILSPNGEASYTLKSATTVVNGELTEFLAGYENGITSISIYKGSLSLKTKNAPGQETKLAERDKVIVTDYQRISSYLISNLEMLGLEKLSLHPYIDRVEDRNRADLLKVFNSLAARENRIEEKIMLIHKEFEDFMKLPPLERLRRMGKELTTFYTKDGSEITGSVYSQTPSDVILDTGSCLMKIPVKDIFGSEPADVPQSEESKK